MSVESSLQAINIRGREKAMVGTSCTHCQYSHSDLTKAFPISHYSEGLALDMVVLCQHHTLTKHLTESLIVLTRPCLLSPCPALGNGSSQG